MNKWIQCYIHDVTRRLSESERGEVRRELEAGIADMLPDNPNERDIVDVLTKLGAPRLLAEQYRQNPRYLISPASFELYISVLKTVIIIVAGVFACIAVLMAALSGSVGEIIEAAAEAAISGALQAAFWVTLGFAISERCRVESKPWTVNDLPKVPDQKGVKISRSSSVAGIVLSVFLTAWLVSMIVRSEGLFIFVRGKNIIAPFSQAALDRFIPYILLLGFLTLLLNSFKLFWARWNFPLCIANITGNLVWVGVIIYILSWPDLLSDEFVAFINVIAKDYRHILPGGIPVFFSAVFAITGLIDICSSVWNTWKGMRETT